MGHERTTGGRRRHSGIGPAQAALATLVVAGTALAALLLRPDTDLLVRGRGPLGGNPVLVVGLALVTLLGGLMLSEKYREKAGAAQELTAVERRLAAGVSRVLLAATLAVPLLALVLHRFGPSGNNEEDPREPPPRTAPWQEALPVPAPSSQAEHPVDAVHFGLTRVLPVLGIALLVAAVVAAGLLLWRHLPRTPAPVAPATRAPLGDERQRLARAVDSGRRALLDETDARAAVIACYAAMERSLADAGVTRRASDSPQDLLERAVAGGLPAAEAAAVLTALFREARYSTHPMDDGHRDRAVAVLAEIAERLRPRSSGPEATTSAS